MISKTQYRRLLKMINEGNTLFDSAAKAGIDPKTARAYLNKDNPFEPTNHSWITRKDPFEDFKFEIESMLELQPCLEAKTIFEYLQNKYPTRFQEGQLRTLQRKVRKWKGLKGEPKEVFFAQIHKPGDLGASDFSHMDDLKVTIQGSPFPHLIYHFVLTYSNWESVTICFSENMESLSEGFQNAVWQAGGAPFRHRTDRLAAAMSSFGSQAKFGARYQALLDHYSVEGTKTQAGRPNENGDVEQAHHRFKKAVDQALMLRQSRDFVTVDEYRSFLRDIVIKRNAARSTRFKEEQEYLKALPTQRLQDATVHKLTVGRGSTVRLKEITYSVPSRLIREEVEVYLLGSTVEVWYQGHKVEEFPRVPGAHKARIDYRHIIDWLIKKPGAFENYRYKDELYPTSTFRAAYDVLKERSPQHYVKEYLGILKAAAQNGEMRVGQVLKSLLAKEQMSLKYVLEVLEAPEKIVALADVTVSPVDLSIYDSILQEGSQS
jgi:hypothetical protein